MRHDDLPENLSRDGPAIRARELPEARRARHLFVHARFGPREGRSQRDELASPFSLIDVVIHGSAIGAAPGVEACLEKEHGCAVTVRREAAMKKLRATREALDIEWSEDEGEFFWVNTDNDKRLSCHGNGR